MIDATALESLRHLTLFDHARQTPDEGRLTHARLAYVEGIVLVATTEHLDGALQFLLATYQRVVVLVEVVHAGDESSPGGLRLLLARLFLQMVVVFVGADQFAHEVGLVVAQCLFQQVAGPRLFQMEDACDEVGDIQSRSAAVDHLLTGILDHLSELGRGLWLVGLVLRHRLPLDHLAEDFVGQFVRTAIDGQRLNEVVVAHHRQ